MTRVPFCDGFFVSRTRQNGWNSSITIVSLTKSEMHRLRKRMHASWEDRAFIVFGVENDAKRQLGTTVRLAASKRGPKASRLAYASAYSAAYD